MNTREKVSWKEFDNFVRYRQTSFRRQEAKRQEELQRKVAEEFARSNSRLFPDGPKSNPGKVDNKPESKARLRFTNPFRKYRPAQKPRNGILKSAGKKRTASKDLRHNVNPTRRSYHDDARQSYFPKKYFTVETPDPDRPENVRRNSTVLPPLKKVPKPPIGGRAPSGLRRKRDPRAAEPSKKTDLTFYDKPVNQFPVDAKLKDSKPRTRYPSPVPSPPPSPPISGFRESPRPKDPTRKSGKRGGGTSPTTSPHPPYNNDRYNRIHPRLEDTYNLSPRPRRTPEVVERRRSPSNLSHRSHSPSRSPSPPTTARQRSPRDEFTPLARRAAGGPARHDEGTADEDLLRLPTLKGSQKRAYLLSGVDGPSLGTRPSRTYHFNPGTTVDDRDFKTVIPAAPSPDPTQRGRRRRDEDDDDDSEDEGGGIGGSDRGRHRQTSRHRKGKTTATEQQSPPEGGPSSSSSFSSSFRYKRDLNTKSRDEEEQTTTRLPPVSQQHQPRPINRGRYDDDNDSQTNSLSTTHLSDLGDLPPASPKVRGQRPVVQTAFAHSPNRMMSNINEYDDNSQQSIDESEENSRIYAVDNYSKHDNWPIHRYRRKGAIACMVRASPGSIGEVKRRLRLVDGGLSSGDQQRMPALPAMEFDADEHIVLSPMQLVWTAADNDGNTNNNGKRSKQRPVVTSPVYIIMPVNTAIYNDALQQLMFIYTVDYREWQYAEGRLIQLPIDGLEHQFYEAVIREPFNNVIFDIKARYLENTKIVGADGGEVCSTMEPGVRFFVHKRTFDDSSKVKLRVEPLDMNETDLANLIPGPHTQNAVAVSPVVKITASEPTKRPITVYLPKPGTAVYGSTRLGLKNSVWDLRNVRVHLYTKDRQVSKYQHDPSVQREFSNEYEFNVRIWKAGGSAYAFLVMTGTEPQAHPSFNFDNEEKGFLSMFLFRRLSTEMEPDELKVRSLGRQLLSFSNTNDIFRSHSDQVPLATMKILKRWKNTNKRLEEGALTRQLVVALREAGFPKEAMDVQTDFRKYLTEDEGQKMMLIFDELRSCPAVVVNWQILGRALGLIDDELVKIRRHSPDLRKRCYATLRMSFELLRGSQQFYRDIVLRYIKALQRIGCPRIAASIERRHLAKFYMNVL